MKKLKAFLLLIFSFSAWHVEADILLLVHGYQGDIFSWQHSGVVTVLEQHNWIKTDVIIAAPDGLIPIHNPIKTPVNKIAQLQLNSEVSLLLQADMLTTALQYLQDRYPAEKVVIVGHSLGGVVARLAMVKNGAKQVKALVSIASPHLGTGLAIKGLNIINDSFPISWIKRLFGGRDYQSLRRSRQLLFEILPSKPGSLLFKLNRDQHPEIRYFSVVRTFPDGMMGDVIVPGFSQDMENVPALKNRSNRLIQGFQHQLSFMDGYTILNIIDLLE